MTDRELMQQALHTLEGWANYGEWVWPESALEQAKRNTTESIAALRERLAQPEQDPVAWMNPSWIDPDTRGWASDSFESIQIEGWIPLYTAPRQWQGLTDEDVKAPIQRAMQHFGYDPTQYSLGGMATIGFLGLVKEIEAKLKEKNTCA